MRKIPPIYPDSKKDRSDAAERPPVEEELTISSNNLIPKRKGNLNMNEQNVKPWQKAQMENFRKREELTWEAHRLSQEAPDPELRERLENYRTKILRDLIDRYHKDWTLAQKEAHLRSILSQPVPTKSKTTPKSCKAPARSKTDSAATWKAEKTAANRMNKHNDEWRTAIDSYESEHSDLIKRARKTFGVSDLQVR